MFKTASQILIIFYHLFLWVYRAGIFVVSFFNPKARLWIKGRVNVFGKIKKDLKKNEAPVLWMHCASLGEFEQGKPVLNKILSHHPEIVPVISFFSPSGYEIIKKKKEFPFIYYLPMDSMVNAYRWLQLVRPSMVIWVKYEYWYFYLKAIQKRKTPLLMVSGIYRREQVFFRWYGNLYRKMLSAFTHFFVQNSSSQRYLATIIPKDRITVSGDTRCDRVIETAKKFENIPLIEKFCGSDPVIVCGSTWEADETIWTHYVKSNPGKKFIIAPHEIGTDNIEFVRKEFPGSILYSELSVHTHLDHMGSNCLIIDNIGMLSKLYYYADIAYVGGGFGDKGLHNILEAAVFGKPVLFGPAIYKNFEASEMISAGGAQAVSTAIELEDLLGRLFNDEEKLKKMSDAARNYVYRNAGASQKIYDFIERHKLLVSAGGKTH